jgi:hypothetical protein
MNKTKAQWKWEAIFYKAQYERLEDERTKRSEKDARRNWEREQAMYKGMAEDHKEQGGTFKYMAMVDYDNPANWDKSEVKSPSNSQRRRSKSHSRITTNRRN